MDVVNDNRKQDTTEHEVPDIIHDEKAEQLRDAELKYGNDSELIRITTRIKQICTIPEEEKKKEALKNLQRRYSDLPIYEFYKSECEDKVGPQTGGKKKKRKSLKKRKTKKNKKKKNRKTKSKK